MIAARAVRAPYPRRPYERRPRGTRSAAPRGPTAASWEVGSFVAATGAIVATFLLVVLYLSLATLVAARGYEAQRLQAAREELVRQNALLALQDARLDSPARIEAEARRIGLVRAARIPVIQAEPIAARH